VKGEPCWKNKRAAEALVAAVAAGHFVVRAVLILIPLIPRHLSNPTVILQEARDAEAGTQWCSVKGEPCWKSKRSAMAFIEATRANVHEARDAEPWCSVKGEPCWKSKREALAFLDAAGGLETRDAEPWCSVKGEPCWKSKREAEAFTAAIQAGSFLKARNPDPWCSVKGEPCW
jgi:transposase InsO family protein